VKTSNNPWNKKRNTNIITLSNSGKSNIKEDKK